MQTLHHYDLIMSIFSQLLILLDYITTIDGAIQNEILIQNAVFLLDLLGLLDLEPEQIDQRKELEDLLLSLAGED